MQQMHLHTASLFAFLDASSNASKCVAWHAFLAPCNQAQQDKAWPSIGSQAGCMQQGQLMRLAAGISGLCCVCSQQKVQARLTTKLCSMGMAC